MRFALLGPVQAWGDDGQLEIRGSLRRTLLAALLIHADTVVSADQLAEYLWGVKQPASATSALYNQVTRLRQTLGADGDRIRAVPPGYLIDVAPGALDLRMFEDRCTAGRHALAEGHWRRASAEYLAALELWRGEPLADVPALTEHPQIHYLHEARFQAIHGRIEADLNLGRHGDLVGELRALTAAHPLREAFQAQLMLALYRDGRQAEALDAYLTLRRMMAEELGTEPTAALRNLHSRILNADPALIGPAPTAPGAAARVSHPVRTRSNGFSRQLPTDTRAFTGRIRELEELLALADAAPAGSEAGMVVISAIDGMAGIGKSALAVHAAHRVSDRFPDGQLFIDLRGNSAGLQPVTAEDALGYLLRSLGVPSQMVPQDLGERAALYRSRLAGTKTLIVLDNAAGTAQVRPLLPGAPGCLVLLTSRTVLAGLDDAHLLSLDVLPDDDAVALLHKIAGPGRIPIGHPASAELIALCGGLPLAIRIVAARLRHRRTLRIEDLVAQIRDDASRLGHLQDEDRNLQALFDASYAGLYEDEQQMFRLLGLVPGPDVDVYAAANLCGTSQRTAERLLETLLDHNLLMQQTPGRYRLHDLLREYARLRADDDTDDTRGSATGRLLDYYQHASRAADRHIARHTRPGPSPKYTAPGPVPELSGRLRALAWMRTERANLTAAMAKITDPRGLIALTASMAAFLQQDGPWADAATLHRAAADIAGELRQPALEANALWDLGRIMNVSGQLSSAIDLFEQALDAYRTAGDRRGQANALYELGRIKHVNGEIATAADLHEQAAVIYRDAEDRQGEANALTELGRVRQVTGQEQAAVSLFRQALPLYHHIGDNLGEANILIDLAYALNIDGSFAVAAEHAKRAMRLYQGDGNRHGEANALGLFGQVLMSAGDYAQARDSLEQALAIDREIGFRQGEGIALWGLGRVLLATGEHSGAADHFEQSLKIFQDSGYLLAGASALHGLGQAQLANAEYPAASESLGQALEMFRDSGDRASHAEVLNTIAELALNTAGPTEALGHYRDALRIAREARNPLNEARALEGAARCLEEIGERKIALVDLGDAVALYRRMGAAEADQAAARLTELRAGNHDNRCSE